METERVVPEEALEGPPESGPPTDQPELTREEQREAIYEQLNWRVESVLALKDSIDRVESAEEVGEVLSTARASIHRDLPPGVEAGAQRYHALRASMDQPNLTGSEIIEYLNFEPSDDVRFVVELDNIVTDLERKSEVVRRLHTPEDAARYAFVRTRQPVGASDIIGMRQTPYDVSLILRRSAFDRLDEGSTGLHARGVPVEFIREDADPVRLDQTIEHERMHNFIEGSQTLLGRSSHELAQHSKELQRYVKEGPESEELRAYRTEYFGGIRSGRLVIEALHNEFLAELCSREARGFGSTVNNLPGTEREAKRFLHHVAEHATAGAQVYFTHRGLREDARGAKGDPRARERANVLSSSLRRNFVQMMDTANRVLYIGKELDRRGSGVDADRRVHALLYLLPPTKYRHIERYLRHRYGEEGVDVALRSQNTPH